MYIRCEIIWSWLKISTHWPANFVDKFHYFKMPFISFIRVITIMVETDFIYQIIASCWYPDSFLFIIILIVTSDHWRWLKGKNFQENPCKCSLRAVNKRLKHISQKFKILNFFSLHLILFLLCLIYRNSSPITPTIQKNEIFKYDSLMQV